MHQAALHEKLRSHPRFPNPTQTLTTATLGNEVSRSYSRNSLALSRYTSVLPFLII